MLGFLLPWISVSCAGAPSSEISFSGFQLAIGPYVDTGFGVQHLAATPTLFLVLLAGGVGLGMTYVIRSTREAAGAILAAGLVSLIEVYSIYQSSAAQRSPLARVTLELGFWLTLVGLFGMVLGSILGLAHEHDGRST